MVLRHEPAGVMKHRSHQCQLIHLVFLRVRPKVSSLPRRSEERKRREGQVEAGLERRLHEGGTGLRHAEHRISRRLQSRRGFPRRHEACHRVPSPLAKALKFFGREAQERIDEIYREQVFERELSVAQLAPGRLRLRGGGMHKTP
mgnify:CR=1 FL=1